MRNDGHRDSTAGLVGGSATAGGTSSSGSSGSSNVVGVHYKVGKKIGEGSFGVIFEGELVTTIFSSVDRVLAGVLAYHLIHPDGHGCLFTCSQALAIWPTMRPIPFEWHAAKG